MGRTQPASGGGALTVRPASGGGATPVQPASSGDADETRGSHHVGGAPVQLAPTDPRGSPAKQPAPIGTDPQGIPIQLNGSDPQGTPVQSNGSDPLGSDPQGTPVQSNGSDPPGTPVQIVRSNPTSPGRVICESPAPPLAHSLDLLHKLQMSEITRGSTPSLQQSQLSLLDASVSKAPVFGGDTGEHCMWCGPGRNIPINRNVYTCTCIVYVHVPVVHG